MAAPAMPGREKSFFIPMEAVEELKCPICFEDTTLLLLPCQHRCCSECVEKMAHVNRRRLNCPQCRAVAIIPPSGFPICRLSQYFRDQLQQSQANQGEVTSCQYCSSTAEARCSECEFLCYRCCTKRKCQTETHKITDINDLAKSADRVLESWLKRATAEVEQLDDEIKQMMRKLISKKTSVKLLESKLLPNVDKIQKVLFVENFTKKEEAEPSTADSDHEGSPHESVPLCTLKNINLSGVLTKENCTSVCYTSRGDVVAGTVNGDLRVYGSNERLKHSRSCNGGVWSVCEYKNLVYAQCGDHTIEVYRYDLSAVVKKWDVPFTPTQVTVSNDLVYLINIDDCAIVKYSLKGTEKGVLNHPSFVYPYSMKPFKNDSIVVCDFRANAVFLFRKDCCIWQLAIENCSGIAIDLKMKTIWVKVYNKRTVTVISDKGDRIGVVDISGQSSGVAYDMAASGDKLYLASEHGLLTSNNGSGVCVIS